MKKEQNNNLAKLQYRINRYRAMGDGVRCQELSREVRKLLAAS